MKKRKRKKKRKAEEENSSKNIEISSFRRKKKNRNRTCRLVVIHSFNAASKKAWLCLLSLVAMAGRAGRPRLKMPHKAVGALPEAEEGPYSTLAFSCVWGMGYVL